MSGRSGRLVGFLVAVATAATILQACSGVIIGQPGGQIPAGCVQIQGERIFGLAWISGGRQLVVTGEGNPFASGAGMFNAVAVDWPAKTQSPGYALPNLILTAVTGDDGTVFWPEADGIYARTPEQLARRLLALDGTTVVDLQWTPGALLLMVQYDSGAAVLTLPLSGGPLAQVLPPDPDAFGLRASRDGTVLSIKRQPRVGQLEFALHADGKTTTIDPHTTQVTFEWAVRDGSAVVLLDPTRGLIRRDLTDPGDGTVIRSDLPSDFWALSEPSPAGVVAYTGRDGPSSAVCFSTSLPTQDGP